MTIRFVPLSLALVAALGLAMSSRLQRRITQPMLAIGQVAQQVMQRRDFGLRAPRTTDDEVGQLAESFNGMLQTEKEAYQKYSKS